MAKLALIAAFLVAILAIEASAHITTMTTTMIEEEEENQGGRYGGQCQQQIQQQMQQLRHCQQYLSQRSPFNNLEMYPQQGAQQQRHLQQCCQALENVDEQCVCEAVKHVVRQQQQEGGGYQGGEIQQVMQKARFLPRICNLRRPQECQIRAVLF